MAKQKAGCKQPPTSKDVGWKTGGTLASNRKLMTMRSVGSPDLKRVADYLVGLMAEKVGDQ